MSQTQWNILVILCKISQFQATPSQSSAANNLHCTQCIGNLETIWVTRIHSIICPFDQIWEPFGSTQGEYHFTICYHLLAEKGTSFSHTRTFFHMPYSVKCLYKVKYLVFFFWNITVICSDICFLCLSSYTYPRLKIGMKVFLLRNRKFHTNRDSK